MDVRLRAAQRERHLGYSEDIAWRADAFGIVLDRWYGVHRRVALAAGGREQTRLPVCVRDTAEGEVEVIRTLFNANERAAELHAGHAGRCRAHEGIEHGFTRVGELGDPIGKEFQRLLCRMLAMRRCTPIRHGALHRSSASALGDEGWR